MRRCSAASVTVRSAGGASGTDVPCLTTRINAVVTTASFETQGAPFARQRSGQDRRTLTVTSGHSRASDGTTGVTRFTEPNRDSADGITAPVVELWGNR